LVKKGESKITIKIGNESKNVFEKTIRRLSGLRSKYFSIKRQFAQQNFISKLKKNLNSKESSKTTEKTNNRPDIDICNFKRKKRGSRLINCRPPIARLNPEIALRPQSPSSSRAQSPS
jgi:hypothetical protein